MRLFGWDMDQWAIALAWAKAQPKTASEALVVKREWERRYEHDPQATLIGVQPDRDHAAAWALAECVGAVPA